MKIFIILFTTILFLPLLGKEKLPTIEATVINNKENIQNYSADLLKLISCESSFSSITSSSSLGSNYKPENIADLSLKTAWIEGKKDYGIGEYIEITTKQSLDSILNGYHKSKELWKANSRVKRFKVYINSKPCCYLKLKDSMLLQKFKLPKNGGSKTTYKFEIEEVYKGSKYKDTAISALLGTTKNKRYSCELSIPLWVCCTPKTFKTFKTSDIKIKKEFAYTNKNKLFTGCVLNSSENTTSCKQYKKGVLVVENNDNPSCVDGSCNDIYHIGNNTSFRFDINEMSRCYLIKNEKIKRYCTEKETKKYWKLLKMDRYCKSSEISHNPYTMPLCKKKK